MNRRTIQTLALYFIYFSVDGKLDRDCAYLQSMFCFKTQIMATDKAFKSSSQQKEIICHNCEHYFKSILCSILREKKKHFYDNPSRTFYPQPTFPFKVVVSAVLICDIIVTLKCILFCF